MHLGNKHNELQRLFERLQQAQELWLQRNTIQANSRFHDIQTELQASLEELLDREKTLSQTPLVQKQAQHLLKHMHWWRRRLEAMQVNQLSDEAIIIEFDRQYTMKRVFNNLINALHEKSG